MLVVKLLISCTRNSARAMWVWQAFQIKMGMMLVLLCSLVTMTNFANAAERGGDTRLVLTGSSTVAPLVLEMAKRFEKINPGIRIDVQTGGSSRGIADVRTGRADIGMASRALKRSESELLAHTIALDGITIIVNKRNPVRALSNDQIRKIFTGQVKNWRLLGGEDKKITVVNKAEGRSTLELFLEHLNLKNSQIRASVIIGDNQQGIKTVAGNPYAIGYVSVGAAEFEENYGTPIRRLPMAGVAASVKEIQNMRFPLSRPLNLITKQRPTGLASRFIQFAQSIAVSDLVAEQYFVSLATAQNLLAPVK